MTQKTLRDIARELKEKTTVAPNDFYGVPIEKILADLPFMRSQEELLKEAMEAQSLDKPIYFIGGVGLCTTDGDELVLLEQDEETGELKEREKGE